jgi:hypothetical protein
MKAGLKDLEKQINSERVAWRAEVRRARWGWVIPALVAGAAGYAAGR